MRLRNWDMKNNGKGERGVKIGRIWGRKGIGMGNLGGRVRRQIATRKCINNFK
jgi:hypothetical protein